jgi:phage terminase large subunit-like protein
MISTPSENQDEYGWVAEIEHCDFPGGYSPHDTRGDCLFDLKAARKAIEFFAKFLVHTKGKLAGQPLKLERWQANIIGTLFGWKRPDGTRRYRMAYIEIPRKNGKSTLSAGIALLLLFLDHEAGAEVYSAASDRDQAAIVHEFAKDNVLRNPTLSRRAKTYRRSIVHVDPKTGLSCGAYHAISSDAGTKHGYNPSGIIADELHAHKNRELWDVLNTGTGARTQPLTVAITTAGYDRESICYEQHDYALKVTDNVIEDIAFLPVIYAAGPDDDISNPEVWEKANPNLGVSVSREFLAAEVAKAKELPSYENTVRRLYFDQWTEQAIRWLPMEKWDACNGEVDLGFLAGKKCYCGLDLASTTDIAAFVAVFPVDDVFYVVPRFYIPRETAGVRQRRDRVPYLDWMNQGLIQGTPQASIDYEFIRQDINEFGKRFDIAAVGADKWNATHLVDLLIQDGINVGFYSQGFASMNAPCKYLETILLSGKIRHGGHKVLRWMAANVSVEVDSSENIRPTKKHSTGKIDGIVAMVMGLAVQGVPESTARYYEDNPVEIG